MKTLSPIAIGKVAAALLKNLAECGFSGSLTYRARSHRDNNAKITEALGLMKATLQLAGIDTDVSDLRLRVQAVGRRASKAEMNWQVDDLINHLLGLVDAAEEEKATPKLKQAVIGGRVVCGGEVVTVIDLDLEAGLATVMFGSGEVKAVPGRRIALMATPFPTCINPAPKVTYCDTGEGKLYRITEGECYASLLLDSGEWNEVMTTAAHLIGSIALGAAVECGRDGNPVAKPEPRPVSVLTMFNGPAKPTPKPHTEATDPDTGHTYRVDADGRILVRQAGSKVFYAGNCNVYVVKAVIRLGLINDDRG